MTEIVKYHDTFFKEVFSRPDVAENLVLNFLPPNVTGALKPSSFRLRKGSFVDPRLKEYYSDLLYRVDFENGKGAYVYLLFEHKSRPDKKVAFQLFQYMARVLNRTTKRGKKPVRPVIPVVLYHGKKKWNVPSDFAALYDAPEDLGAKLLDFDYYLIDLSAFSDDEIKIRALACATLAVALLLMKNIFSPDLSKRLAGYFELVRNVSDQSALEFLESVFRYLGVAKERVKLADAGQALKQALGKKGETFMYGLLEKWVNEGVEKGKLLGMQAGVASLTIRLLTRRFGKLDDAVEERIRLLPLDKMEKFGEDLLDIPDKGALTEWLDRSESTH